MRNLKAESGANSLSCASIRLDFPFVQVVLEKAQQVYPYVWDGEELAKQNGMSNGRPNRSMASVARVAVNDGLFFSSSGPP